MSTKATKRGNWYSPLLWFWLPLRNFRILLALVIALVTGVWTGSEPTTSQTTTSCNVSYRVVDQWATTPTGSPNPAGGFKAEITITNSGTTTMNGWNVTWTFANGQNIYQNWEGSLVQMGANESVTNLSYNGTIAPSGSRTFGFLATWSLVNNAPTMFGGTCSGSTNVPPTVNITAPPNNSSFTTGSSINITANASDTAPGTVASVQFFDGSTSLGTDTAAPYAATLPNATAGSHTLTARAT